MARPKKNVEPIVGTGKDPENKLTVQKSIPLFSLWQSDMSLAEFKILDTYLSRINSHEPEKRTVLFARGELERLLGVKKINKPDLSARLDSLGRFVELSVGNNKKTHKVALFEEATGEMDDNGQWILRLTCTAKAMKYIFNVEKLGYLRYKLRCVTCLTSRYTYILFTYLEHNRFRKSWEVDVDELKEILNCQDEELYQEFKFFNQRILKRCQKELLEKTECRFVYEPVKKGRKVTAVRFTLETLSDIIEETVAGQMSLDDYEDELLDNFDYRRKGFPEPDPLQLYLDVLPDSMTREQAEALRALAWRKIEYDPHGLMPRDNLVSDYLRHKVLLMNAHNRNVRNPFNYLKSMIENDPDIAIY